MNSELPSTRKVIEYNQVETNLFETIKQKGEPAILKNCNFGECTKKWSLAYLSETLAGKTVVIHESNETDLNFLNKNFAYRSCQFEEFAKKLNDLTSSVYLRSTSTHSNKKKQAAARIENDFPALASDLKPPEFIEFGNENKLYHSSVLRIASAKVQIWTHFDLYDNVLCQTEGTKRILLIPPEDTKYLYVRGDKSRVNCWENWSECLERFPLVKRATLFRCQLEPGDCLFIPSLWWHNIKTIATSSNGVERPINYSIGFNIFWRDVAIDSRNLYAQGDVYGNKNLTPYEFALGNLSKAVEHLNKLPAKYKSLYKVMLFERFKEMLLFEEEERV